MSHKTTCEKPRSISNLVPSLFNSDNLKVRRTRCSLASLSPGGRVGRNNSISIQDLMGGEKRATDIHSPNRLDRSPLVTTNTCESSPIVHAEDKIKNILDARKSRQRRRSDISKSLDHNISETMLDMNSRASFNGLPKGMENITVPLNDLVDTPEVIEKEGGRRRRRNSLTCLSPGRLKKSIDLSRDQRSRLTKNLENEKPPPTPKKGTNTGSFLNNVAFSPRSTSKKRLSGTSNTLRDKLRQRLQGVNYCDLDESTHSGESATKRNGMVSLLSIDDDDCTADESDEFGEVQAQEESLRRSKSRERRPRSKSSHGISRKQSDSGDRNDSSKKQHRKTKRRARSKSKGKRRSSRLLALENEEKISNINSTSASKRGKRRPKSLRSNDASIISDDNTDGDYSIDSQSFALSSKSLDLDVNQRSQRPIVVRDVMDTSISSTENPAESPRCKKTKKRSKSRKTSLNMSSEEELSLGSHLESESTKKRFIEKDNLSQVTEERSHYTHESCEAQTILLQFDPTSASGNHVRSVNQNQAKKTSESISGLHGTTSTLEIAEIAGLPSFEKLKTCDSTSTTAGESLSNSSRSSSPYLSMMNLSPKKQSIPRSSSCFSPKSPSMQTAGGLSFEGGGKNAEWNLAGTHTPYQRRGSIGRNIFFNKKSSNDGAEKHEKFTRRSSIGGAIEGNIFFNKKSNNDGADKYEKPRRRGSIGAIEGNIFFNKKSTNDGADKYEKPTRRGSIGAIEGNIFFNKKSTNDGAEKYEKPARRGSIDKPTRRSSIGPMMRLGGRFKTRDNENPFGDAESLLSSEF